MKPRLVIHPVAALSGLFWLASAALAADSPVEKVSVRAVAYFDFDRASLRPEDQASILADVGKMKNVTWQTVTATGHTDSVGAASYNARLAARRAQAIKGYLVGKGLDGTMIKTQAKAAEQPVADNLSSDGRAKNRRTEIEFQGVQAAAR